MGRKRTQAENIKGLRESLEAIEVGLGAYHMGKMAGWHSIVTELFKLLLDKHPLALTVFPSLTFHPMIEKDLPKDIPEGKHIVYSLFSQRITLTTGQAHVGIAIFDEDKPKIPLNIWLKLPLMVNQNEMYSIEKYIDILRHNEAAHFSETIGPAVQNTQGLIIRSGGRTQTNVELYLVGLGEYVVKQLRKELEEIPPSLK